MVAFVGFGDREGGAPGAAFFHAQQEKKVSLRKLTMSCMLTLASASAMAGTKDLDPVVATGQKNPQEFDLKGIKQGLARFNAIERSSRDKIRLAYYVYGKPMPDLSSLTLALVEPGKTTELTVLPGGRIDLPASVSELPDSTLLVSNAPKKSFSVIYKFDVVLRNGSTVELGYLRSGMEQAQGAWKRAYGFASLLVPKFNCLDFQFQTRQSIAIHSAPNAQLWSGSGDHIQVPLRKGGWPDSALLSFDPAQLIRVATCKE